INQLLASAGYGSRRHCEELVREGRVEIDGEVISELGISVDPSVQKVRVDGVPLKQQRLVYFAVNKPNGVVTTNADPMGRPRVIDLVPPTERVFPVGRLDLASEGLILLTNDGDLAHRLAHPRYAVQKVYRVTVAGRVDAETMQKMRRGIYIAEGLVQVDGARVLKARPRATDMEIRLREGKNREIRRVLARFGHKVQKLRRIAIGPLRLGDTPPGAYRKLTRDEIEKLQAAALAAQRDTKRKKGRPKQAPTSRTKGKSDRSAGPSARTNRADSKRRNQRKGVQRSRRPDSVSNDSSGGVVIGADVDAAPVERPRAKRAKKRAAKKAVGSRGFKKRPARGNAKRSAGKTTSVKRRKKTAKRGRKR
ncbi:MAG: pseudouridine synthase, partial [Planctomycetota bacterium]